MIDEGRRIARRMDLRLNRRTTRLSFRISRYGVTAISYEIARTSLEITHRHDL